MKTLGITIAALMLVWLVYKLWAVFAKDRAALAAIPDDQLLGHYNWELAEGRDGKKFEAEFKRRHGSLPC